MQRERERERAVRSEFDLVWDSYRGHLSFDSLNSSTVSHQLQMPTRLDRQRNENNYRQGEVEHRIDEIGKVIGIPTVRSEAEDLRWTHTDQIDEDKVR